MKTSEKINLFCLPFAGASVYSYREFSGHFDESINVVPVELPGRGKRISEPLLSNLHNMADDIFNQIKMNLNVPYAIYGHSIGSCIGYLVIRLILDKKLLPPSHLFFSGSTAPSDLKRDRDVHLLPRKEFIMKLLEYDGSPEEVLNDPQMMDIFEPVLRADIKAINTYIYEKSEPFDIPLTAMIGTNDKITYEEALRWQEVSSKKISVKEFSGGHFFIFQHQERIGRLISNSLIQNSQPILSGNSL